MSKDKLLKTVKRVLSVVERYDKPVVGSKVKIIKHVNGHEFSTGDIVYINYIDKKSSINAYNACVYLASKEKRYIDDSNIFPKGDWWLSREEFIITN